MTTPRQRECLCPGWNPGCTNEECPRLGVDRLIVRVWRRVRRA